MILSFVLCSELGRFVSIEEKRRTDLAELARPGSGQDLYQNLIQLSALHIYIYIYIYKHGWEHKISKSRQTQANGGKNCEKAGKLPRLCGETIQ